MCVVSMVGDHYNDKWKDLLNPPNNPLNPPYINTGTGNIDLSGFLSPTRVEFDQLKKEVLEMKELLKKAVEYDIKNNQAHCEMEEKIATLKKIAELVGVSLEDVFKK